MSPRMFVIAGPPASGKSTAFPVSGAVPALIMNRASATLLRCKVAWLNNACEQFDMTTMIVTTD